MRRVPHLSIALLLLLPRLSLAQDVGTITGSVTSTAGRPVPGAYVTVVGTNRGAQVGADGRFTFSRVPAGTHDIRARFVGYAEATRRVTVIAGSGIMIDIVLAPQAVMLEELIVVGAKLSGPAMATFQREHPTVKVVTKPSPKGKVNPFTNKPF